MIDAHKAALDVIEANQYAPTGVSLQDSPISVLFPPLKGALGITSFYTGVVSRILSIVWQSTRS